MCERRYGGAIMEGSTRLRVARRGVGVSLVKLSGEWDIRYRDVLERTLGGLLRRGSPTFIDLSGVTFLDAWCVRELAVQYQLHMGDLVLCNPSPQTELAVSVCDLEEWIDFTGIVEGAGRSAV
jgi:anti-anti-sigma factor